MEVSFVRTQGQRDRVYVRRPDGSESSWEFPTYGDQVPHDLVHLVVEAVFEIPDGLYGRVAGGIDLKRVSDHANRVGGPNKYAALGEDQRALELSEALAALVSMPYADAAVRVEQARAAFRDAGRNPPADLEDRLHAVVAALDAARARWRQLVPKGALRMSFDPRDPGAALRGSG